VFKGIQQRVKEGRWEVVGGMWVEPDCNLPSGESWFHHLLYSKLWFRKNVGADARIGWNPDSFGYNLDMPMFYANADVPFFVTQKIGWNETNVFPYRLFWWQSPDSSRVLTYFPFDYVNEVDDPYRLIDWMRQFESNTGFTKMMCLFGVGDHGGGPSLEMLDRIKHLDSLDIYPAIEYGKMSSYIEWLQKQDLSTVPVWKDELYLEYHQGTYTTQAKMKEHTRRDEVLLSNAEKFSSIASMYGRPYNGANIEEAWHNVLFNQFHDILPGSGIRENYIDASEKFAASEKLGNYELDGSLKDIAGHVNTSSVSKGSPLLVFNPLAWARADVVRVQLPEGDNASYTVLDAKGKEVPSQIVERDKLSRDILFFAHDLPALGYSLFQLHKGTSGLHAKTSASPSAVENARFRVAIDPDSGWIRSLYDKHINAELLAGYGNELQLLEDKPSAWDAWNIGLTGVKYPSKLRKIEVVENGPVRTVVRVTRDYLKPGTKKDFPTEDFPSSFFTQDIVLYDDIDRVDFKTDVDWWEDKTMLKVAFPHTLHDTVATFEVPYGTITRSTQSRDTWEQAKVEVPAQRWADLTDGKYGVSILNRSKYGYDIKSNIIRLSLLRSPKWPDPTADRGKHSIEYALLPHDGPVLESNVTHQGYEYNNPLIGVITTPHKGALPPAFSFVHLEPSNLILTEVKKAEGSDSWIIQWYDAGGKGGDAVLTLPKTPAGVSMANFMEEPGASVPFSKNVVKVRTKPHSVVTVKINF
jgi:alpha-mannosidase